jgi:hypothetical protein
MLTSVQESSACVVCLLAGSLYGTSTWYDVPLVYIKCNRVASRELFGISCLIFLYSRSYLVSQCFNFWFFGRKWLLEEGAISSQSSMIILSDSDLRGTHGSNPRHQTSEYISSELDELSVLTEQLAEWLGIEPSSTKSINVSGEML